MGISDLKDKLGAGGTAVVEKQFPQMIAALEKQVAMALPKHLSAERMSRIALTAFRQNADLAKCEPRSVFASVVIAAQMGLEPNIMGQGFLVPYNNRKTGRKECQFIPGWKGLVDLAQRSGRATVWTGAVHEGDLFEYTYGVAPTIEHKPGDEDTEDKLTYVYAVGWVKGAEHPVIEVWRKSKVIKHRNKHNKVGDRHYSFGNFEMYARKVVLLQVLKYMPMSVELATAMNMEADANTGTVRYDLEDSINADFHVMASSDEDGLNNNGAGEPEPPTTNTATPAEEKKTPLVDPQPKPDTPAARNPPDKVWTEADMLAALKAADTLIAIEAAWNEFPEQVPIAVEALRNDRLAALSNPNARSASPMGKGKKP